jgi:hypothetical protein
MTGGGARSEDLNRRLAQAAQAAGIGMAVGSQSLMLKDASTAPSYQVRRWAPDILLFADLGLVHLNRGLDRAACVRAVEAIGADALMLYANHMHEAFQVAGDLDFTRLLDRLAALAADFPYPIVVKEVGNGFSAATLARLGRLPLAGVDVAGMGGTHWGRVEALVAGRALDSPVEELGVPTAESLEEAVRILPPTGRPRRRDGPALPRVGRRVGRPCAGRRGRPRARAAAVAMVGRGARRRRAAGEGPPAGLRRQGVRARRTAAISSSISSIVIRSPPRTTDASCRAATARIARARRRAEDRWCRACADLAHRSQMLANLTRGPSIW